MTIELHLLVAADEPTTTRLQQQFAADAIHTHWQRVATLAELDQAIVTSSWDVVLLSDTLPNLSERHLLAYTRKHSVAVPLIVVARTATEERVVAALRAGACDFVTLERAHRLGAVITQTVIEARRQHLERSRTASASRLRLANGALLELARSRRFLGDNLIDDLRAITEVAGRALQVARASVWLYDHKRGKIRALDLFETELERHSDGMEFWFHEHPSYFFALEHDRIIVAADARIDPRTREYSAGYLEPLGISALIDVATRLRGELVGVVCLEHVGATREWSVEEEFFVNALADLVSLALEASERQRAEAELARREQLFRHLVETTNVVPWEASVDPVRFTYIGKQAEQRFGYPCADWLQPGFWELILHPEDRAATLLACHERAQFLDEYELEYRVLTAQGGVVWVHDYINVIRQPQGRLTMRGFLVDITQRRQSEEALETSRQHLELLVRRSPLGVIEWNPNVEVVAWNPAATAIFGYTSEEALGQHADFIVSPEDRATIVRVSRQVLTQSGGLHHSNRNVTKDGRVIDCEWYNSPLIDDQGQTIGLMSLVMDVSERERMTMELQRLNAELEQRVHERTRQLQAANMELEAFCYSVSHDLRAPLRAIDGFSKVLLEDYLEQLDVEGQDSLRRVRAATRRMGELIDDLLTLSRVSRSEMNLQELDLGHMATVLMKELRQSHPERAVEFILGSDLRGKGDANLLRLALENLLTNAWKYTSKHPQARIEFAAVHDSRGKVFYVRDDGAGFDPAYADKLFQPFQRLHRADEFDGHGIGLATVQRVIHRHGGQVWGTGSVEKGATFSFTLGI